MTDADANQYAMWVHLSAFSGFFMGVGWILAPLILWLVKKDQSPIVDRAGRRALNFQITMFILVAVAAVVFFLLAILTLGIGVILLIPVVIILGVAVLITELVSVIQAAMAASQGREHHYPFGFRFLAVD